MYDKKKFKFKLYAPNSIISESTERYGKFHVDDFQGLYASRELARRAGQVKKWYQIIEVNSNIVIEEKINQDSLFK